MEIAIIGGHGKVARLLTRKLTDRGNRVRAVIRDPDQVDDVENDGAEALVIDVEHAASDDLAEAISGCDAVVFAAGAGAGSGAARKETVDYGAAATAIEAAQLVGVDRYVMVSAMGTDDPPDDDDVFSVYLRAKARADAELMDSGLQWTVVRPGGLTDDPATGSVTAARHVDRGSIPREDVAAVLAATLDEPATVGQVFELVGGSTPVAEAVRSLSG